MQYSQDPNENLSGNQFDSKEPPGRAYQSEDPNVYSDLIQQIKGKPVDISRMSDEDRQSLRTRTNKNAGFGTSIVRACGGIWDGMFSAIGFVFQRPVKRQSQCELYGHVLPEAGWVGVFPKCRVCGTLIKSKDDLKRSTAREK